MIKIGAKDWVRDLMLKTEPLGWQFWSSLTPATESELQRIETGIQRKLDAEFREFYRTIGYGPFEDRNGYTGDIYSPDEILECIPNPVCFITGSTTPGAEWATQSEHIRLWLSRGRENSNPHRFTDEVL